MKTLLILTKRNSKLFFKDKGMFFSSLITPAILLVLYVTFLSNVYRDSFLSALPEGFSLSDSIIDGVVGGQLASSLLAVCCVTIAFCSNLLMIQDKVTGSVRDLTVTPVKRSVLAMGYFASSALVTLIVCLVTCGTSLLHNHWMRGALDEMGSSGVPSQVICAIRDGIDCNIYFSGKAVSEPAMFLIVAGSVLVVTAIYILINALCRPRYGDR